MGNLMKIKYNQNDIISLLLLSFTIIISIQSGMVKYISLILISSFCILNRKFNLIYIYPTLPTIFVCFYGVVLAIVMNNDTYYTFKEAVLLLIPCIIAVSYYEMLYNKEKLIDNLFIGYIIVDLIFYIPKFTIENLAESQLCPAFGVFVCYYFFIKQKKIKTILALLFLVLAYKRITYLALVFAFFYYFCAFIYFKKGKSNKKIYTVILVSFIMMYIIMLCYLNFIKTGGLEHFLYQHKINSMGRTQYWLYFIEDYKIDFFYVGKGMGYVLNKVMEVHDKNFELLHNDIMKIYIDCGLIGFTIWFLLYLMINFKVFNITHDKKKTIFTTGLYLYSLFHYMTDNYTININYNLTIVLIVLSVTFNKTENTKAIGYDNWRSI